MAMQRWLGAAACLVLVVACGESDSGVNPLATPGTETRITIVNQTYRALVVFAGAPAPNVSPSAANTLVLRPCGGRDVFFAGFGAVPASNVPLAFLADYSGQLESDVVNTGTAVESLSGQYTLVVVGTLDSVQPPATITFRSDGPHVSTVAAAASEPGTSSEVSACDELVVPSPPPMPSPT